jgi:hypothetical protein
MTSLLPTAWLAKTLLKLKCRCEMRAFVTAVLLRVATLGEPPSDSNEMICCFSRVDFQWTDTEK